jgi:AmmeMemoRadiSam system protein A
VMTSEADRLLLLQIARDAIAAHVGATPDHVSGVSATSGLLERPGGAFVSLHNQGDLRGCIGHIEATEPLGAVVPRCAVAACSSDPRFPHVTAQELAQIDIEISLLGPIEPIAGPQEIEIGRHGLVVELGSRRGLLLPQVATQWQWDADAFLAQTCHKAGIARDAWKQGAKLWRFEAEVFGEPELRSLNTKGTKDTKEKT